MRLWFYLHVWRLADVHACMHLYSILIYIVVNDSIAKSIASMQLQASDTHRVVVIQPASHVCSCCHL